MEWPPYLRLCFSIVKKVQTRGVLSEKVKGERNMKTVEEMKKDISRDECLLTFDETAEFRTFLDTLTETDEEIELKLNSIKTFAEEGELKMTAATTAGPMTEIKVSPYAIRTLEKRSGDTAVGHDLMAPEQILASMNNYWPLHGEDPWR